MRRRTFVRRFAALMALGLLVPFLTGCGDDDSGGPTTLTFYSSNPNQEPIVEKCAAESAGRYAIDIQALPNTASGAREQLLRRLAAQDRGMDILSIDPPFMAEFANAGFLRPFTDEERAHFSYDVLAGPLEQGMFEDTMYSAPANGNTQLLWYRKSVLKKAGIDPAAGPVTWDQLIDGAEKAGVTLAAQGRRNESLMVWVNALVLSAGGSILTPDSEGKPAEQVKSGLDSDAGREAARIMRKLADSSAAYPGFSTGSEENSRAAFQAEDGGFMVNWPYVWAAAQTAVEDGSLPESFLDDVGWARYPRVLADRESAPPSGGLGLSISAFSRHKDLAVDVIRCVLSPTNQKAYMFTAGDPAVIASIFDDPEVRERFPMADAIREGMADAGPRPVSPYYGDVTAAVQAGFHPPGEVTESSAKNTGDLLEAVLSNERLI
ncbi:extracellular solute-binding protein [Cryptosporangium aurantiacum]|uniref:Carbohydrate ABC transporter substrate-binding protein, CUT1 family n=1 Tax=Cryptosporangium aurantiacum TaxID=134849 RepID=A0A1M7RHZ4_9ACTN|nr:extracellular solute-binding protein [Cryptosporangium aurantiacum]SHN45840.1 carbohydrate ABC transporter substrate-binding protein, CUT1 family [Cryptosporangium aurantiacum]